MHNFNYFYFQKISTHFQKIKNKRSIFAYLSKTKTMDTLAISSKLNHLSADLQAEVNGFIDYLLYKQEKSIKKNKPQFGCAKGKITLMPDFDDSLPDFDDYK